MDSLRFIRNHLDPLRGKRVLDNGCGGGSLARALAVEGAQVTGIDPAPAAISAAGKAVPEGMFKVAMAQALPFPDETFDATIFLNSLHHVQPKDMARALKEARRVTVRTGKIIVIEPLAEGTFNAVLKLVNDEAEIRAKAQQALQKAIDDGVLKMLQSIVFARDERFTDFDAYCVRATAADPEARGPIIEARHDEIEAEFMRHARKDAEGRFWLTQPLKADALVTGR